MAFCKDKLKVAMLLNNAMYQRTFHPDDLAFLRTFADILNEGPYPDKIDEPFMQRVLPGADACITCWGTPVLTKAVLDQARDLKVIAHGAGTPKAIINDDFWGRNIRIFTAAPVIAIDVAETALGAIIYSLKCLRQYERMMRDGAWVKDPGQIARQKYAMKRLNDRLTVGIIGLSHVGRHLIRFLKPFGVRIQCYDPYVSEYAAGKMGVAKVSLAELMAGCDVVTVHAPNLLETRQLVSREMLALLKDGALFVNTARGAIVDQDALIAELKSGRINAYLDVFEAEPLPLGSELYKLENVLLSPHISGGHTENGGYERGNYLIQQLYGYYGTGMIQDEVVQPMIRVMA